MIKQVLAILKILFRSVQHRRWLTLSAVLTYFGIFVIYVGLAAIKDGITSVFSNAGAEDIAVIRSTGAESGGGELLDTNLISDIEPSEYVARKDGRALVFPEYFSTVKVYRRGSQFGDPVRFRAVASHIEDLRPEFKIVAGRKMLSSHNEVIVGRELWQRAGYEFGQRITIDVKPWTIVGVFENNRDVRESELWTDLESVQSTHNMQGKFLLAFVKLKKAKDFALFKRQIERQSAQVVEAVQESQYFSEKAKSMSSFIDFALYFFVPALSLCIGLCSFAIANSQLEHRRWETNLYLAIGFNRGAVFWSVCAENIVLALLGGALGALLCATVISGYEASTRDSIITIYLSFQVEIKDVVQGLALLAGIAAFASVYPALFSSRQAVSTSLKEA